MQQSHGCSYMVPMEVVGWHHIIAWRRTEQRVGVFPESHECPGASWRPGAEYGRAKQKRAGATIGEAAQGSTHETTGF